MILLIVAIFAIGVVPILMTAFGAIATIFGKNKNKSTKQEKIIAIAILTLLAAYIITMIITK